MAIPRKIATIQPFVSKWLTQLKSGRIRKWCTFDVETTGLDAYRKEIFAFLIGQETGEVTIYRVDNESAVLNKRNWNILKTFLEDDTIAKIGHNIKFDFTFASYSNTPVKISIPDTTVFFDTMVASQILHNLAPRHGLDWLAWEWFGFDNAIDAAVKRYTKALDNYSLVPAKLMTEYQEADHYRTLILFQMMRADILDDDNVLQDYANEMELIRTTMRLENFGVTVDVEQSIELLAWCKAEHAKVVNEVKEHFSEYINLNSALKLQNLLYRRLGFPVVKKSKGGNPSTDKDALMELRELFPTEKVFEFIFRWRSYDSGATTVQKYLDLRDKNNLIHPTIKTNHAKTGRESSENPNMQNVSKDGALKNLFPVPQRKCFRCADGSSLYLVDYAGIEMRLIIDSSGEEVLIKLLNEGGDPHAFAAEQFFGETFRNPMEALKWYIGTDKKVKKLYMDYVNEYGREAAQIEFGVKGQKILRGGAKNGSFALAYGAGLVKIAQTLGMSIEELRPGFEQYKRVCPRIASFTADQARLVKELGYVTTAFGRKLSVSYDKAYTASNYKIQGTAAGILKRAQVRVDAYCRTEWDDKIRLVLPIHDELIISVPDSLQRYKNQFLPQISRIMCYQPEIVTKLDVEWKHTTSLWNLAKGIKVEY